MKQKLLNNLRLRAVWLVAMILCAVSGAWAQTTVSMTSFTGISGNVDNDSKVSFSAYKGGGTSAPAVNSSAIRLYQNSNGNTAGYVVIGVAEGYTITSATIQSTMATTTGYLLTDSDPGSTTPEKNTFTVSNYSLAANTDYTVNNISTRYITFACFGTSSSSRLYLSKISVTYQAAGSGPTIAATTTTINAKNITNTDVYVSKEAGSLSAAVTETEGGKTVEDATIIWSGNKDGVATIDSETGVVTLVSAGTVTFTASYAGSEGEYMPSSNTYELTVTSSAPFVQPTEFNIALNNSLFGTSYSGSASGVTDENPVNGSLNNVTVTYAGSGNHYINDSQIRFYPNNKLTFEAPSGYNITQIVFYAGDTWTATISSNVGTYSSDSKTWTGEAATVLFTGSVSGQCRMTGAAITLEKNTPKVLSSIALSGEYPTTFHVGDAFSYDGIVVTATYEDESTKNVTASATFSGYDMANAGDQTVTVSYTENEVTKTATYDITVNAPATLTSIALSGTYPTEFQQGDAFSSEGIVVTANYDDKSTKNVTEEATFTGYDMATIGEQTVTVTYGGKTATYDINVAEKKGTAINPYTVAEAIEFIGTLGSETSSEQVYVSGIISQVDSYNSKYSSITYWISDDGSTTGQMEVYSGKGKDGADFSSVDDLQVGDIVTVKGNVKMYSSTPEFIQNNQIVSFERKELAEPEFSFGETNAFSIKIGDNFTAPTLSFAEGFDGTVTYESSNTDVATVANDGTVTVKAVGETVITASSVKTEEYKAGSASYTLTVNPTEAYNNDFAFAAESVTIEVSATQAINYTTSSEGAITWESSNTEVATVDENGNVTAIAIGEATITANQAATDAYKAGSAQLIVTVIAAQPVETFDLTSTAGYKNSDAVETVEGEIITLAFDKGSNNTNSPKYYENGDAVRMYNGNTLTISSEVAISKIEFTFISGNSNLSLTSEEGSYENDVWTGTANEVIFTNGSSQSRIQTIKVTYDANAQIKEKVTLSFGETTAFTVLPNADFTAPTLTATDDKDNDIENLTFTYESDDEDIAFVDANSGEILIGEKEGTATITATFAGNNDYKSATASYTITVEKAEAGLAYETTSFEVNVGADFNAPELVNPNQLTVTYSSDNENVAIVDENVGTIVIGSTGKAVITATFAGNDTFKAGNASYTINVVDPNVEQNYVALVSELNGGYYAMSSSLSSGVYGYEVVDAVNGKVINGRADAISWLIEDSGNGQSIQNKKTGKYLAYGGSGTNLVASDNAYEWGVSDNYGWVVSNRTFMYRESASGFKAYATSNTGGDYGSYPAAYTFASGYTREVTANNFGTICLPYDVEVGDFSGVKFYQIAGKRMNGDNVTSVILSDEVTSLVGGAAYIYQANADAVKLIAAYSGDEVAEPFDAELSETGLTGTYEAAYIPQGKYVLKDNTLFFVNQSDYVKSGANKAYIDLDNVPEADANVKGIRIDVNNDYLTGINGFDVDGRQNVIFNLSGQRVSNANKGVYIVNGKKISVK